MDALEKDALFFQTELPKLKADAGKFALVFEQKYVGAYQTYQEAVTKGYEIAGVKPFLVEQITDFPQVQHFTRVVGFEECLTSL